MTSPFTDILERSRRRQLGETVEDQNPFADIAERSRIRQAEQQEEAQQRAQQASLARARTIARPDVTQRMDRPVDPAAPSHGGGSSWGDAPTGFWRNVGRSAYDAAVPGLAENVGSAAQTFADQLDLPGPQFTPVRAAGALLRSGGAALEDLGARNRLDKPRVTSLAEGLDSWQNFKDYAGHALGQGLGSSIPFLAAGAVGGIPAAVGTAYTQQVGEVGKEFDEIAPGMDRMRRSNAAMGLAAPLAALDVATELNVLGAGKKALTGGVADLLAERTAKEAAVNIAKGAAKGAVSEGLTEAAQEGGQYFGARKLAGVESSWKEGGMRMLEAGIAGGLAGGVMGGAEKTFEEGLGYQRRKGIQDGTWEYAPGITPKALPRGPIEPDFTVEDTFKATEAAARPTPPGGRPTGADGSGPIVDRAPRKGSVPTPPAPVAPESDADVPAPAIHEKAQKIGPTAPESTQVEPVPSEPTVPEPDIGPISPDLRESMWQNVSARRGVSVADLLDPREPTPRDLTLTFSDGSKVPARWRVVDADQLTASHKPFSFQPNPRYPAGVQGRDYAADPAAQQNVQRAAMELDADRLLDPTGSPEMGGPTIAPDGTVIAGNQRAMMMQRARQEAPERFAAYSQRLRENAARYGLTDADFAGTENPVLVREIDAASPEDMQRLNRLSDTSATKAKSVLDEAAARAAVLRESKGALDHFAQTMGRDDTVASYLSSNDGKVFVRRLLDDGVIAPQEAARYMDVKNGSLTDEGKLAVRRMLLVSAIGDPSTVARAPDAVLDKLEGAVPHIVRADLSGDAEYQAGPLVKQALDVISEARDKGVKLADLIDQVDLEGHVVPEPVARMARFLAGTKRKADVTEMFRRFGQFADESAARARDGDLFGDGESGTDAAARMFGKVLAAPRSAARETGTSALPRGRSIAPSSRGASLSRGGAQDLAAASPESAPAMGAGGEAPGVVDRSGAGSVVPLLPRNDGAPGAAAREDSDGGGASRSDRLASSAPQRVDAEAAASERQPAERVAQDNTVRAPEVVPAVSPDAVSSQPMNETAGAQASDQPDEAVPDAPINLNEPLASPTPQRDRTTAVTQATGALEQTPGDPLASAVASLSETVRDLRATVEAMGNATRAASERTSASAEPTTEAETEPTTEPESSAREATAPRAAPAGADPFIASADEPTPAPAGQLEQQIAMRGASPNTRAEAVGTAIGGTVGLAFGGPFGGVWGALTGYAAVRTAQQSAAMIDRLKSRSEPLRALIEINRTLAASVGVSMRQGRGNLAAMRALGWYLSANDAIRVKRFGDVRTGAHEVGHYLSNRYLDTSPEAKQKGRAVKLPKAVREELLAAGKALYGSRIPNGGYAEEGIAEFFRFWVTDPAKLTSTMPNTRAFFDGLLLNEPTIRAALDQAQADYARFVASPAHARVAAMLSVNEGRWAMPSFPAAWANLKRSWIDDLSDIREAVETLQQAKPVTPSRNAYLLARLSRGVAGEAEQAIDTGIRARDGKVMTQGIREALQSIPADRLNAFVEYLVAERALEKHAQGINTGVDIAAAKEIQTAYENDPVFRPAAEALWAHSNALIALRVEGGLLTQEQADAILERNAKRVPFQREFSDEEKARGTFGSGRAPARNSSGIQRMMGSDRKIIDPLESILRETHDTYRQVRQHQAVVALVEHAREAPGGAQFVEVLREAPKDVTRIAGEEALGEVLDRLTDLGILDPEVTASSLAKLSEDQRDTLYAALVDFRERSQASGRERKDLVLPLLIDGKREWVQVKDAALYEALLGMNREEQRGWVQIAAVGSKLLRAGATLTTEFIARNPGRDALSAFVRTRGGWALPFEHLARGIFHLAKQDELYEQWRRAGGDNAAQLSLDRAKNQDALAALRRTLGERVLVSITPGNWLDTLRLLSSISENATRLGEFDLVMKKQREAGASEADAVAAAAFAARDVTVDFAKAGTAGRAFNQIVAFFNANVQDLANMAEDLNVRRDKRRALEVLAKAAILALPTMLLWLMQRDDKDYDEIPQDVRDRNYVYIHKAIGPDGQEDRLKSAVFTFPKSYGLAGLVSLMAERIAEYLDKHDPASLQAIRETIVGSYVPSVVPTAAIPLFEVYANRDQFRNRPIVSQGLERLLPEDQATDRTGETARVLGQAVGYSPALLEHLIVGYTAGLGRSSLEAVDWLVRGARDQAGLEPLRKLLPMEQQGAFGAPVARAFLRPLPASNAQSITEVYKELSEAEQSAASYARSGKQDGTRAQALLASRGGQIAAALSVNGEDKSVTRAVRAELDKLNDDRRSVLQSDLPTEERRRLLREIDDQRIEVARVGRQLLAAKRQDKQLVARPDK